MHCKLKQPSPACPQDQRTFFFSILRTGSTMERSSTVPVATAGSSALHSIQVYFYLHMPRNV